MVGYEYSTWGEVLSITDTSNANVGNLNPYRYRGYRFDSETGLYYLQSRYYNPQWGRFLNADDTNAIICNHEHLMQYNLFAYAFNNPVNRFDDAGFWPGWVNKVLIGTAVIAIAAVLVATAGAGTPLACFAAGALHGATVGAISGAAYGAVTGVVVNRLKSGSWKGSGMAALNGAADGYMMGAITGFIAGGVSSSQCFVAGTVVLTSIGYVAIENIRAGDLVWSEDPETGQQSLKTVVQTFESETHELVHVFVGNEEILTTLEHPFFVLNRGWVGASNLQQGDIVELKDGLLEVLKVEIEITKIPVMVYNFEVEDYHTYFVSDDAVLVHNMCSPKNLPKNARTTTDWSEISRRLQKYHGVDVAKASERLHKIKAGLGMGGASNVVFDLTGNVYNKLGEYIGSLTK